MTPGAEQNRLGVFFAGQDRWDKAYEHFLAAAEIEPAATFWNNACVAALKLKRLDDAIRHGRRATALDPHSTFAAALARALECRGELEEALAWYRLAAADQGDAETYFRIGSVLSGLLRFTEAVISIEQGLELRPDCAEGWKALGNSRCEIGELETAQDAWKEATRLDPHMHLAHSQRLIAMHYNSQHSPEEIFEAHRRWGSLAQSDAGNLSLAPIRSGHERIARIGYLESHPVRDALGAFTSCLWAKHSYDRFEIVRYTDAERGDPMAGAAFAGQIHHTASLSNFELARLIRSHEIDVLVDLGGHTSPRDRLLAVAMRPAPVQITAIGYPDTTGLSSVDYRLTDPIADPIGLAESLHTEKLLRLDRCFLCYSPPLEAPEVVDRRRAGQFVYGCFNALPKLNSEVIAVWGEILRLAPSSRLVLKSLEFIDEGAKALTARKLTGLGISLDRVDLLGPTKTTQRHLATYGEIDFFLDPFPYNGTTTTCEALWMGVPGVCLEGSSHVARVGASLFTAVGLSEWIARSVESYIELAVGAANRADMIREMRLGMRERLRASPLLDSADYTRQLECAYDDAFRTVWQLQRLSR